MCASGAASDWFILADFAEPHIKACQAGPPASFPSTFFLSTLVAALFLFYASSSLAFSLDVPVSPSAFRSIALFLTALDGFPFPSLLSQSDTFIPTEDQTLHLRSQSRRDVYIVFVPPTQLRERAQARDL